jgi:hypothetical protein
MSDEAILVARLLFWTCAAGVAFLPTRWAIFALILASHIDITSLTFASATTVGFENTVRIVGLPLLLLVRTHFLPLENFRWTLAHKAWLALMIYAAIAGAWGGFPLSTIKLIAYLTAYVLLYALFLTAWDSGWLDIGMVRLASWCVIALAVLQVYGLGNGWGGPEERFTSFSTPQYFAAFLVAMLAILVFSGERGFWHYATCVVIIAAIVVNGSRYVTVSTVLLLIVASLRIAIRDEQSLQFRFNYRRLLLTLAVSVAGAALLAAYLPENRIDQLVTATADQGVKVEDVGTLAWRLGIYAEIWTRLEKRTPLQLFFGSGTGSGAALMVDYEPALNDLQGIDANRSLHSEYLRALYEWGILGLTIFLTFLVAMIVGFSRKIAADPGGPALAFLGVLPSVLIGLAIENVLAGAVSAGGVGILLALSFAGQTDPSLLYEPLSLEPLDADSPALPA